MGFKIKDFKRTLKQNRDLYLKMTMLNDFNLDEITLARGFAEGIRM